MKIEHNWLSRTVQNYAYNAIWLYNTLYCCTNLLNIIIYRTICKDHKTFDRCSLI